MRAQMKSALCVSGPGVAPFWMLCSARIAELRLMVQRSVALFVILFLVVIAMDSDHGS